ncbi:hypothetical protein [Algoriphagus namhaensis]
MTDHEFDLLDELYFVQPYSHLVDSLGWEEALILQVLVDLRQKGWIKCLRSPDEEVFGAVDILAEGKNFYYLATKEGLMKHNMG